MLVQAIDRSGKPFNVTLSFADFWTAYDGPLTEPVIDEIEEPHWGVRDPHKPWLDDTLRPELRPPVR